MLKQYKHIPTGAIVTQTAHNPSIYENEFGGQIQAYFFKGQDWEEIKERYAEVNLLFGDIVKVTPSSKVVGDMALFMVQNKLSSDDIYQKGKELNFPESVISFFKGDLGQPTGGFPKELKEVILNGRESIEVRPGSLAESVDFASVKKELKELLDSLE